MIDFEESTVGKAHRPPIRQAVRAANRIATLGQRDSMSHFHNLPDTREGRRWYVCNQVKLGRRIKTAIGPERQE
jgi:hypothetical protein